jgi:hypothetical protein
MVPPSDMVHFTSTRSSDVPFQTPVCPDLTPKSLARVRKFREVASCCGQQRPRRNSHSPCSCRWRIVNLGHFLDFAILLRCSVLRDLAVLFIHLIPTIARLAGPGGARSVVAESVLVKQQLLILNRSRHRSPNLRVCVVAGLCTLLMRPGRLIRSAIVWKPSTLLSLHRALKNRKYRLLFSLKLRKKPGPKGPDPEVIAAVVQMKQRNPTWGCPRIAQQIALAFDI